MICSKFGDAGLVLLGLLVAGEQLGQPLQGVGFPAGEEVGLEAVLAGRTPPGGRPRSAGQQRPWL